VDHVLAALGAKLRRCHDCHSRRAWFGFYPIPVGDSGGVKLAERSLLVGGAAAFVLALVWMLARGHHNAG
jgi:hypothetical protein